MPSVLPPTTTPPSRLAFARSSVSRSKLGPDFDASLRAFLLEDRLAAAALEAKPSLAPDLDTLMDRLGKPISKRA
jgi:hypothetical protein